MTDTKGDKVMVSKVRQRDFILGFKDNFMKLFLDELGGWVAGMEWKVKQDSVFWDTVSLRSGYKARGVARVVRVGGVEKGDNEATVVATAQKVTQKVPEELKLSRAMCGQAKNSVERAEDESFEYSRRMTRCWREVKV